MKAILLREFKSFFGSITGYLVIGFFLFLNGLFLFVLDGSYNILQSGYNDLTPFFKLVPWILLFLIPAVTMKSFSDEKKQGTIELLFTKPISMQNIVLGKFLGAFCLIVIALLPTLLYIFILNPYGNPINNMDMGSTIGAYIGLLFLVGSYVSIGIFTSTLSDNQIVAFIVAIVLCYLAYFGFDELTSVLKLQNSMVEKIGMNYHFKSLSRGVLDTRDIIYFISVMIFFISATVFNLKTMKK